MNNKPSRVNHRAAIEKLVRPNLQYDDQDETHRRIRSIGNIMCTHGANLLTVERLARDGKFSGGSQDPAIHNEFFTNPNPLYRSWHKTDIGKQIARTIAGHPNDPILQAIMYSEAGEVEPNRDEDDLHSSDNGVVIAFGGLAVSADATINEDLLRDDFELVLPEAPNITTIEGIYPVTQESADELLEILRAIGK